MGPQLEDDWEEITPDSSAALTEELPMPPPVAAPSQYTPEEQERLQMYLQNEKKARQRASEERHATVQSKAAAKLGTLGGFTPQSSLDYEGSKAADAEANKSGQLANYMMNAANERKKKEMGLEAAGKIKSEERSYQENQAALNREHSAKLAAAKTEADIKKVNADYQRDLALLREKQKGEKDLAETKLANTPEKTDPEKAKFQKTNAEFNARASNIMDNADKLYNIVDEYGTFEATGPASGQMDSLIYNIAIDYAKIVDPDSVAREGEVAAAEKYMLPVKGLFTKNSTAKTLVKNLKSQIAERIKTRGESTPGYEQSPELAARVSKIGGPSKAEQSPIAPTATASTGNSPVMKEGEKYFRTTAGGQKKEVVKAFKDKTDGKIHYKYADGTVE